MIKTNFPIDFFKDQCRPPPFGSHQDTFQSEVYKKIAEVCDTNSKDAKWCYQQLAKGRWGYVKDMLDAGNIGRPTPKPLPHCNVDSASHVNEAVEGKDCHAPDALRWISGKCC